MTNPICKQAYSANLSGHLFCHHDGTASDNFSILRPKPSLPFYFELQVHYWIFYTLGPTNSPKTYFPNCWWAAKDLPFCSWILALCTEYFNKRATLWKKQFKDPSPHPRVEHGFITEQSLIKAEHMRANCQTMANHSQYKYYWPQFWCQS